MEITPEQAIEIDPSGAFERVVYEEEAKAHSEGREAAIDVNKLLQPPDKKDDSVDNPNNKMTGKHGRRRPKAKQVAGRGERAAQGERFVASSGLDS